MAKECLTPGQKKKFGIDPAMSNDDLVKYLTEIKRQVALKKRTAKIDAIKHEKIKAQVFTYTDKNGHLDAEKGFNAMIYRDRYEQTRLAKDGSGWGANLDSSIRAVNANYQGKLYVMMEELMPKILNVFGKKKRNRELVRAIYGTSADAKFSSAATAWRQVNEEMRLRFNKAGGDIKNLEDWNLPQRHDSTLLEKHGYEEWHDSIMRNADIERMDLGDAAQTEKKLKKMYDRIVREGLMPDSPSNVYGKSKIANRHQEQRVIHFKDADSWTNYNERFSNQDAYGAMMDHVTMVSNEIALMEALGSNPGNTIDSLGHMINAKYGKPNATDVGLNAYANIAGRTNPHNVKFADSMSQIRNWTSFLKLPMAVISAPPDLLAGAFTAHYNGIPSIMVFKEAMAAMTSTDIGPLGGSLRAKRKLAADLMMNLDFMIDEVHSAGRYFDVGSGGGSKKFLLAASSKAAAFTVRAGGLNHWTVANKMGFHFSFMRTLADTDLINNKQMMKTFRRYGLDQTDLNMIVNSNKMQRNGVTFLDPNQLPQQTAERVAAMVNAETKLAVPEADARVRGFLNQGSRRGEVGGEAIRLGTMFKTFPASLMLNNWARFAHGSAQSGGKRMAMAASMLVGTTVMGTGIVQLKRFIDGKPEVDWDSKELWSEGMLQGGFLSILGDVFADDARTYGSMMDFIGGPALGVADKLIWRGILGSLDDARNGDFEITKMLQEAGGELADFPPARLFYTKLILQRYMDDEFRRWASPSDYDRKKRQRNMKEYREYQNSRWW